MGILLRGRVLIPDYGYWPRPQLELQLRACIGAILDKPMWWNKWDQSDDQGNLIRNKWLREIQQIVIHEALNWTTKEWYLDWNLTNQILAKFSPLNTPDVIMNDALRADMMKRCSLIDYYLLWANPSNDGKVGSEWNHEEQTQDMLSAESLAQFQKQNRRMESYGQVIWYFALLLLNRRVRQHVERNATSTEPCNVDITLKSSETLVLVEELLSAVARGEVDKTQFRICFPDADVRPHIIDALWFHIDRIRVELENVCSCVVKTLMNVMTENKLSIGFVSNGPVEETWISDGRVDRELQTKFASEVAELEMIAEKKKDWHPESNDQVLDLVHPSLYCCVFGVTKRSVKQAEMKGTLVERMHRCIFGPTELVEKQPEGTTASYQWLPSEFHVDDDGQVTIESYINNLHPVHFSKLYDSIAQIFASMVPMFDKVLSCLAGIPPLPVLDSRDVEYRPIDRLPQRPRIPTELQLSPHDVPAITMRGATVQVIVKIAEIVLTPETSSFPGGSWHVEGTDTEEIVATGIYYFGCENITESKLSFRALVSPPDYQHDDYLGMAAMYGLAGDELLSQHLGSVTAINGRSVVFPNTLQHHVDPFELQDPTKPGVRKILAFFLVDPNKRIPSTLNVVPQQQQWLYEAQQSIIRPLGIPDGVIQSTLHDLLGGGMTLDQAKEYRSALMKERRVAETRRTRNYSMEFSLCEH